MTKIAQSTRGGVRAGAGRKKLGKALISVRVKPGTRDKIKSIAEETGCQMGAVIDFIIEDYERSIAD